ncbi:MAG: hypothetical protein ACRCXB_03540 [Aeromonadaceae bacterium]
MQIAQKVALSARPGVISLFREGIFVRCYNQSLMRWGQIGQPLKVSVRPIRCLQGELVYSGGMPESSWRARYVDVAAWGGVSLPGGRARVSAWFDTPWGYEGSYEGEEPDWRLFCAENPCLPTKQLDGGLDVDACLSQLATWDIWQQPLARTAQMLEACKLALCSQGEEGNSNNQIK